VLCSRQGATTCWFSEVGLGGDGIAEVGDQGSRDSAPLPTLLALERTIAQRRRDVETGTGAVGASLGQHGQGCCRHDLS
jgi:hypothetical protein